jgi:hypothetical protein
MPQSEKENLRYQLIALTGHRNGPLVNKNLVAIGMRQDKVLNRAFIVVCL